MPVETINSAKAAELLQGNTRNRALNKRAVARYADQMRQGHWLIGNDAICIAADGTLLNGQHRLNAVIEADVELQMLIRHGVSPDEIKAMDQGAKRQAADIATLAGHEMSRSRCTQLRYLATPWERTAMISSPPVDTLIDLDDENGVWLELAVDLLPRKACQLPVAVSAAALQHYDGGDVADVAQKIKDFWSIYFNNTPAADRLLDTKDADFIPCQGYMQYQGMLRDGKKLKSFEQYKVCCMMLAAYINGDQLTRKNRLTYSDALDLVPALPVFTY